MERRREVLGWGREKLRWLGGMVVGVRLGKSRERGGDEVKEMCKGE